jgi:CBS domain-containing protein
VDVATFLRRFPPFDSLPAEALAHVAGQVQIEHFAPGTTILQQSGEPARFLYVVRRGAVEVVDDGSLIDLLGEGEIFGAPSLLGGFAPTVTVRAHEDTLCYLIDEDAAAEVLGTSEGVRFVMRSMRRRVFAIDDSWEAERDASRFQTVASLVRRGPVTCEPATTIAEAAAKMARERVSCLLVPTPDGIGILTDRDLRTRVVAERRGVDTPVSEVMTFPAESVPSDAMAGEVLLAMIERGFHHFPVHDGSGELAGVVTDSDLMGLGRHTPFALKSAIERARSRDEVMAAAADLPLVVGALVDSSADPVDVGHVVAFAIDAVTKRLLELGLEALGEPPTPWAWLALGSAARQEQALHTDQDHALAYGPGDLPVEDVDAYFAQLAIFVTDGLEDAGVPKCHGDAMASHPQMRRSLEGWTDAFREWISEPGAHGSIMLSIAFDYRRVAGPLDAEAPLDALVRTIALPALPPTPVASRARPQAADGFFRDLWSRRRASTPAVLT